MIISQVSKVDRGSAGSMYYPGLSIVLACMFTSRRHIIIMLLLHLHYIWQYYRNPGFNFTMVVLHSETRGTKNGTKYQFLHNVALIHTHHISSTNNKCQSNLSTSWGRQLNILLLETHIFKKKRNICRDKSRSKSRVNIVFTLTGGQKHNFKV